MSVGKEHHSGRAKRWAGTASIFILPEAADVLIYFSWGRRGGEVEGLDAWYE